MKMTKMTALLLASAMALTACGSTAAVSSSSSASPSFLTGMGASTIWISPGAVIRTL